METTGEPDELRSLRVITRAATVRAEPRLRSRAIGRIARGTRLPVAQEVEGEDRGCGRWVSVEPRGWVCTRDLESSEDEPGGDEQPRLRSGQLVPGRFGKIMAGEGTKAYRSVEDVREGRESRILTGTVTVKRKGITKIDGKRYWRTDEGELIPADVVRDRGASGFTGVSLSGTGAPPLPFGWAQNPRGRHSPVRLRAAPDCDAEVVRRVDPRTVLPILESSSDGKWHRVGEDEWIASRDLRVARPTKPPASLTTGERWIDIDLKSAGPRGLQRGHPGLRHHDLDGEEGLADPAGLLPHLREGRHAAHEEPPRRRGGLRREGGAVDNAHPEVLRPPRRLLARPLRRAAEPRLHQPRAQGRALALPMVRTDGAARLVARVRGRGAPRHAGAHPQQVVEEAEVEGVGGGRTEGADERLITPPE